MRKVGCRMSDAERMGLSVDVLVQNLRLFVRSDFGGRDRVGALRRKFDSGRFGVCEGFSDAQLEAVGRCIVECISGCRRRIKPSVEEVARRFAGVSYVQKLVDKIINGPGDSVELLVVSRMLSDIVSGEFVSERWKLFEVSRKVDKKGKLLRSRKRSGKSGKSGKRRGE